MIVVWWVVGGLDLVGPVDGQSFCSCASKMTDSRSWVPVCLLIRFFFHPSKSKIMARHPFYFLVTP